MRKRRRMTKRIKNRLGLGNDVYLRPVHWIMDDGCLRFLEEVEEEGRWRNMGSTRERKERGREKEGNKERRERNFPAPDFFFFYCIGGQDIQ